jgi:hypothetical protein
VDAPGKNGKTSMLEQVNQPNLWRKMMMVIFQDQNKMGGDCERMTCTGMRARGFIVFKYRL